MQKTLMKIICIFLLFTISSCTPENTPIHTPSKTSSNIPTTLIPTKDTQYNLPTSTPYKWKNVSPEYEESVISDIAVIYNEQPIIYIIINDEGTCDCSHFKALYKSSNLGLSWENITFGLENEKIESISIYSSILYLVGEKGVYKSVDGGNNWLIRSNGLNIEHTVGPVAVDPKNPSILYVGGENVQKSTTGGLEWRTIAQGINAIITSIAIDPQDSEIIIAGGNGLFRSITGGENWEKVYKTVVHSIVINPQVPSIIYAGTDIGVLKSINGGRSWDWMNTGLEEKSVRTLLLDLDNPSIIYAGTRKGIYKSNNSGSTWKFIGPSKIMINSLAMLYSTNKFLLVGTIGKGLLLTQIIE